MNRLTHVVVAVSALGGCSADDPRARYDDVPHAEPPPRPAQAPHADGPGATFAVSHYYVGTLDREGKAATDAWRSFGYDIDGLVTSHDLSDECRPPDASWFAEAAFHDGNDGIDNAFGFALVPMLSSFVWAESEAMLEDSVNEGVDRRDAGLVFRLTNLGPEPSYDLVDTVAVDARAGDGGWASLDATAVRFPRSYVAHDVWVSDDAPDPAAVLSLTWRVGGTLVHLRVHRPVVTMRLDRPRSRATEGVISGVLDLEELTAEGRRLAALLLEEGDPACPSLQGAVVTEVQRASDILLDGTVEPTATCTGVSIGIGFDAVATETVGEAAPDVVDMRGCGGA